ncbi:MAG: right-handed parallel beta-helix repeat-containing protein [Candidatus Thorarchaeota archaeon]
MSSRPSIVLCILLLLAVPILASVTAKESYDCGTKTGIETTSITPSSIEHSQITIRNNRDFPQQGWEGSGTSSDPYIIENLNISLSSDTCILIYNVTAHFVIRNSYLSTSDEFAFNIQFISSSSGKVDNCTITGGGYGVSISSSSGIDVANCTIYSTNTGISISNSESCFIGSNSIYGTNTGVRFYNSMNNTVADNKVYRAEDRGIVMDYWTSDNRIFYNHVGWNGPDGQPDHAFNAVDQGENNVWDDNISLGNFWSEYEGSGIYAIEGTGEAFDRYPTYFNDTQAPIFKNRAEDLAYDVGDRSIHFINWTAHDAHPYRYEIVRDDSIIQSGIWHLQSVRVDVGRLDEGVHNFTINFVDGSGNRINDSAIVYVILYLLGDVGTDLVGYASIIAVFAVMSMVILLRKRR